MGYLSSLTGLRVSQLPFSIRESYTPVNKRPESSRCRHKSCAGAPCAACPQRYSAFSPNEHSDLQLTGAVLQAAKRLQINVHVEKVPYYRYLSPHLHHPHFLAATIIIRKGLLDVTHLFGTWMRHQTLSVMSSGLCYSRRARKLEFSGLAVHRLYLLSLLGFTVKLSFISLPVKQETCRHWSFLWFISMRYTHAHTHWSLSSSTEPLLCAFKHASSHLCPLRAR